MERSIVFDSSSFEEASFSESSWHMGVLIQVQWEKIIKFTLEIVRVWK